MMHLHSLVKPLNFKETICQTFHGINGIRKHEILNINIVLTTRWSKEYNLRLSVYKKVTSDLECLSYLRRKKKLIINTYDHVSVLFHSAASVVQPSANKVVYNVILSGI